MTEPETTDSETTEPQAEALEIAALERAESEAAAEAAAVAPPQTDADASTVAPPRPNALEGTAELDDPLTTNDYTVAFSPRQVAVGLAIVAGLVAVLAARRRGKRNDRTD